MNDYKKTALDRQKAAYENYMAQLKEVWTRECDEIIDMITDGVMSSKINDRILDIPEEGIIIITERLETILTLMRYKNAAKKNTEYENAAETFQGILLSIKRSQKLEELGL